MRNRSVLLCTVIALGALALISCPPAGPEGASEAEVISTLPAGGAAGVAITTAVSAVFDMDMREATFTPDSFTLSRGAVSVDGTVAYEPVSRTAVFTPSAALDHETEYTANIGTAVRDAAGKALAAGVEWRFTTVAMDTAATPTFDPAGGVFENDVTVTISSATPGVSIYYELTSGTIAAPPSDPTDPTTSSTPYTTGIAVSGQNTMVKVKAIAVKTGINDSAIGSAQFTVDATAFTALWDTAVWDLHEWDP